MGLFLFMCNLSFWLDLFWEYQKILPVLLMGSICLMMCIPTCPVTDLRILLLPSCLKLRSNLGIYLTWLLTFCTAFPCTFCFFWSWLSFLSSGSNLDISLSLVTVYFSDKVLRLHSVWGLTTVKAECSLYSISSLVWDNSICLLYL